MIGRLLVPALQPHCSAGSVNFFFIICFPVMSSFFPFSIFFFFFFNDTATTEIYTLSLHDALPIYNYGIFLAYFRESGRGFSPSMFWSDQCNYPTRSKLCCLRLSRSPRCVWAVPWGRLKPNPIWLQKPRAKHARTMIPG